MAIVAAQKADVSDVDEDMGLDEEELRVLMAEEQDEEEEATVTDEDQPDETESKGTASGKAAADENVSFQVRKGSQFMSMSLGQQKST